MKTALLFVLLVVLAFFRVSQCKDLVVGVGVSNRLIWQQRAEYSAIPLKKRVKEVFFSDPGQLIIRGIIARDLDKSDAEATITSGGVGYTFSNIRLKSERGSGLNYNIEIYV